VHAEQTVIAEVGPDVGAIGRRRAGRPAVLGLNLLWVGDGRVGFPEQLAVGPVEAKDATALAVVVGRGEEDPVTPDDGRGVALAGWGDFPADVADVGPGSGVAAWFDKPLTGWAPPARPVFTAVAFRRNYLKAGVGCRQYGWAKECHGQNEQRRAEVSGESRH